MNTVGLATRERLFEALGSPQGVTVARERTAGADKIVVRIPSESAVPASVRVCEFNGFEVQYRKVPPGESWRQH
jgi:hypothetical protein